MIEIKRLKMSAEMNPEERASINYEDMERRIVLKIEVNDSQEMRCFWMEQGQLRLSFMYDHRTQQFSDIDGQIGQTIANSALNDKIKKERLFEALSHAMWYLNIQ
jgi:hypothetical protein